MISIFGVWRSTRVSEDLIRLINLKLICHNLFVTGNEISLFELYMAWGDNFHKKFQILEKKFFILFYCSDFRYESNGIFVLGVGFFSSDKFRLFN